MVFGEWQGHMPGLWVWRGGDLNCWMKILGQWKVRMIHCKLVQRFPNPEIPD